MAFGRAVILHSFQRASLGSGLLQRRLVRWNVGRAQHRFHACIPSNTDEPELKPDLEADALLTAFEKSLEAELEADSKNLVELSKKRKLTKDELELQREAEYLQKLELLTALPEDLVIKTKDNQCPGCGCALQSIEADSPGYVPPIRKAPKSKNEQLLKLADADEPAHTEEKEDRKEEKKAVVCQRCYKLSHYGSIEDTLRVKAAVPSKVDGKVPIASMAGPITDRGRAVLSAARFRKSLELLRKKSAVIVYLVDIFDFHGTFLNSLQDIVGDRNPLVMAVNKVDLLPKDYKKARVERWVRAECGTLGLRNIAAVHMVSSMRGTGVEDVLADAVRMARGRRCDIYVVGAANVGKSSFINRVVALRKSSSKRKSGAPRPGALTTSVIPGTTLDTIRIPLGNNLSLYDTPGVIVNHQLTNRLGTDELRAVLPSKNVERVTYRLGEGKALFLGGLARIDVLEGKPFFFTVFVSPNVKVHPGRMDGAPEFLTKHVGGLLTPPFDNKRLEEMGRWTAKTFTTNGEGWKKAAVDVVLSGVGWVALTGSGSIRLRVNTPYGMGVFTRDALMPFEVQAGASKYTGGRGLNPRQERESRKKGKDERFSRIDDWS